MVRSPCYPHQGGAISVLSTPKCGADKAYLQKIYSLYGLEHHTVGDVTMETSGRKDKQVNIVLLSQWTL